jgi:hypothetical protein
MHAKSIIWRIAFRLIGVRKRGCKGEGKGVVME